MFTPPSPTLAQKPVKIPGTMNEAVTMTMQISETTAKNAAKSAPTVDYDGMVDSFKALKPGEKVQFLTWAAGDIGYKLTSLLDATAPADAGEMPAFLQRKPAEGVPATGEAAGRRVRRGAKA